MKESTENTNPKALNPTDTFLTKLSLLDLRSTDPIPTTSASAAVNSGAGVSLSVDSTSFTGDGFFANS